MQVKDLVRKLQQMDQERVVVVDIPRSDGRITPVEVTGVDQDFEVHIVRYMESTLRFFNIHGAGDSKFEEMQTLTTPEALEAIRESAATGSQIELYYTRDDADIGLTPDIGFIFTAGVYTGRGLGTLCTYNQNKQWLRDLEHNAESYLKGDKNDVALFFNVFLRIPG